MAVPKKKDFAGENKNKDTYDKDWVFHNGAWVTKKQRKSAIAGHKQQKAYLASIQNPSAAAPVGSKPPTMTTAPIIPMPTVPGFAPGEKPAMVGAKDAPPPGQAGQVPTWWINQAIQNPTDPNQQFANVANALLPTLAPEDQRTLATYLATNFKDVYGGYANANFGTAPTQMTDDIRRQYLSPQRAQQALGLLDRMKAASGSQNMGAGYDFLRNAVGLINQFVNPQGVMGRENYNQFTNAVSSLIGQAGSNKDLAAYSNLAQLFNLPKFTAGPLVSNAPNTKLFS